MFINSTQEFDSRFKIPAWVTTSQILSQIRTVSSKVAVVIEGMNINQRMMLVVTPVMSRAAASKSVRAGSQVYLTSYDPVAFDSHPTRLPANLRLLHDPAPFLSLDERSLYIQRRIMHWEPISMTFRVG